MKSKPIKGRKTWDGWGACSCPYKGCKSIKTLLASRVWKDPVLRHRACQQKHTFSSGKINAPLEPDLGRRQKASSAAYQRVCNQGHPGGLPGWTLNPIYQCTGFPFRNRRTVRKSTLLRTYVQQEGFPKQSTAGVELFAKNRPWFWKQST